MGHSVFQFKSLEQRYTASCNGTEGKPAGLGYV